MPVGEPEIELTGLEMLVDDVEMKLINTEMIAAEAKIPVT